MQAPQRRTLLSPTSPALPRPSLPRPARSPGHPLCAARRGLPQHWAHHAGLASHREGLGTGEAGGPFAAVHLLASWRLFVATLLLSSAGQPAGAGARGCWHLGPGPLWRLVPACLRPGPPSAGSVLAGAPLGLRRRCLRPAPAPPPQAHALGRHMYSMQPCPSVQVRRRGLLGGRAEGLRLPQGAARDDTRHLISGAGGLAHNRGLVCGWGWRLHALPPALARPATAALPASPCPDLCPAPCPSWWLSPP